MSSAHLLPTTSSAKVPGTSPKRCYELCLISEHLVLLGQQLRVLTLNLQIDRLFGQSDTVAELFELLLVLLYNLGRICLQFIDLAVFQV